MTISERLAAFVAHTGDTAIPAAITAIAKRDVLDYVGVALLGATTPIGRVVRAYLDDVGGAPQATVLGVDRRTLLAAQGYTSTARCFEGRLGGFCKATADRVHLDPITADLGARWGIAVLDWKRYPSCTGTHRILDAAITVAEIHDLHPDAIASIELGVDRLPLLQLDRPAPQTGLDAKFSHQFCLALGLLERRAGIADYSDAKVRDMAIRRLLGVIQPFYEHPDGYVLTVTTSDGTRHEHPVQPRRRLAERDLIQKFHECACTRLDARALDAAIATIQKLDRQPDVAALMARLR